MPTEMVSPAYHFCLKVRTFHSSDGITPAASCGKSIPVRCPNPSWVAWAQFTVPDPARWIAAGVAVALIPVMVWVFASIGKNISASHDTRHGHVLVTHGPYRWVRHPLYSVGFLFAVALTVITALWWLAGMILPLFVLLVRTTKEEAKLIETFGDEYRDYMKRTGRFLPRLSQ